MTVLLLYPNQCFDLKTIQKVPDIQHIVLVEDPHYFYLRARVHKMKIAYIFACMSKQYQLLSKEFKVTQIRHDQVQTYKFLKSFHDVTLFDPIDHDVLSNIQKASKKYTLQLRILDSPMFILTNKECNELSPKVSLTKVYQYTCSKTKTLEEVKSTDGENRKRFHEFIEKDLHKFPLCNARKIAIKRTNEEFPSHIGDCDHLNKYPITKAEAMTIFRQFLKERFTTFGDFQDAVAQERVLGSHSFISAAMNVGLLNPLQIIKESIACKKSVPLNSVEGFIRQIAGWREYMRLLYIVYGKDDKNHFNMTNRLNWDAWNTGTTGLEPLDAEICKAKTYGYAHHIVRLMYFLSVMVMCNVHPHDVVRWFSEMVSMDAYHWVMVSNVMSMGYYDPRFTQKPYISTSNYIVNLSDYSKNGEWRKIWDSLFYSFLKEQETKLAKGGSSAVLLRNLAAFDRKSKRDQEEILQRARDFKLLVTKPKNKQSYP
jgi:deoxyribodipyrimidine photolyase-related protein